MEDGLEPSLLGGLADSGRIGSGCSLSAADRGDFANRGRQPDYGQRRHRRLRTPLVVAAASVSAREDIQNSAHLLFSGAGRGLFVRHIAPPFRSFARAVERRHVRQNRETSIFATAQNDAQATEATLAGTAPGRSV